MMKMNFHHFNLHQYIKNIIQKSDPVDITIVKNNPNT